MRGVASVAAIVGGVGSVMLLLRAGHPPLFLVVLFSIWVLFPFAALLVVAMLSTRWPDPARTALHATMVTVAAASLVLYTFAIARAPLSRPTPWFVMVPPVSCVLAAVAVGTAAFTTRRRGQ